MAEPIAQVAHQQIMAVRARWTTPVVIVSEVRDTEKIVATGDYPISGTFAGS